MHLGYDTKRYSISARQMEYQIIAMNDCRGRPDNRKSFATDGFKLI